MDQLINAAYVINDDNDIFTVRGKSKSSGCFFDEEGIDQANVIILGSQRSLRPQINPLIKKKMIHGRKIILLKKDAKTGLLGEELIINYEKDFLIKKSS